MLKQFTQVQDASAAGSERSDHCRETSFCHKIWHKPFSCRNGAFDFTWNSRSQFYSQVEFIALPEWTYCDDVILTVIGHMRYKLLVTPCYVMTYRCLCHKFYDVDTWFLMAICGKLFAIRDHDVYYVSPISEAF